MLKYLKECPPLMWCGLQATLHAHGDMVVFRVLCAIRTSMTLKPFLFVQLFASKASCRCKHDMGVLSW